MKIKLRVFLLLLAFAYCTVEAQNISKVGVSKISLRNTGEIIQGGIVKGYYSFYNLEKVDKGNINYLLSVVDENLHEVNSINIVRSKNYILVESAYNGNAFAFLFYDTHLKKIELISYDVTLKQTGQWIEPLSSVYLNAVFQQIARGNDPDQQFLVPVKNEGFVHYTFKSGNNAAYQIKYFDNALKRVWVVEGNPEAHEQLVASDAFQSEQYVASVITKQKRSDLEYSILVNDRLTGKEILKTRLATAAYTLSPSDITYDSTNSEIVVFGEFYDIKDKELSDRSKGFGSFVVTMDGKIEKQKFLTWADLSKMAPVDEKGKMDGSNTNIYFHDFVRTDDGQIFGIGEQYKKVANGGAIAAQILLGPRSAGASTQINVYNMVIFQFSPEYDVKKVYYFDKSKTKIPLPQGSTYLSAKRLSYYVKARGGFDFSFDQLSADKKTFTVTYVDYDRSEGGKRVVGSITYTPEHTFAKDKMVLTRKSTVYKVMRAKQGYFLVMEYFRSDKKLDMRLEKINF